MKEVVLGLLGLGNIGGGVWDLIRTYGGEVKTRTGVSLRVKKALVLDKRFHGGKEVPDEVLTTDRNDILEDPEIQIVCEFLGGEQPAASMMPATTLNSVCLKTTQLQHSAGATTNSVMHTRRQVRTTTLKNLSVTSMTTL